MGLAWLLNPPLVSASLKLSWNPVMLRATTELVDVSTHIRFAFGPTAGWKKKVRWKELLGAAL